MLQRSMSIQNAIQIVALQTCSALRTCIEQSRQYNQAETGTHLHGGFSVNPSGHTRAHIAEAGSRFSGGLFGTQAQGGFSEKSGGQSRGHIAEVGFLLLLGG